MVQRSPSEILQSAVGIKESPPKAPERSVCLYGMVMTEASPHRILGETRLLKPNEWNRQFFVTILFVSSIGHILGPKKT